MAKPPQPLKLQIEDYPDFDKETAEKLFPKLNQFFDEVTSGLDRGLTAQDNLRALVKTIDISVVAPSSGVTGSGTLNQVAYWASGTGLTGSTKFVVDPATGNFTVVGILAGAKLQVTDNLGGAIRDASGNNRIFLPSAGIGPANQYFGIVNGLNHLFDTIATITSNATMFQVRYGGASRFAISRDGDVEVVGASTLHGKISQDFTDSSASPGAATINKPTGRSAIAAGASSVTITNSVCTAASMVKITKRQFDATLTDYYAVCAAGSFTVTGNANATAAWAFDWQVIN